MNVLILGSGGREHAFAWKLSQSKKLTNLFIAPGNAGTELYGKNCDVDISDFEGIKRIVLENNISMVIVGPESPLVLGIHDYFLSDVELSLVSVIGPIQKAALLEGSKAFAKEFMKQNNIPTARFQSFTKAESEEAEMFLESFDPPYVLKADGLASGKGVMIVDDIDDAQSILRDMFKGKFDKAGERVVIEQYLEGIELSVFVLTDGINYKILPEAKDYKRVGEGDTGLNTGGMGAISPVPFADYVFMKKVEDKIIIPTINGLKKDEIDFKGFIFFGLINVDGEPFIIEYNVRMGDPEAEVVLPRIKTDLIELFEGVSNRNLKDIDIEIDERTVSTVVLVSDGYPGKYDKDKIITNIESAKDCVLFYAGIKKENNRLLTNGGRVMAVSAFGENLEQALKKSYINADIIDFENKYYRKDIGFELK